MLEKRDALAGRGTIVHFVRAEDAELAQQCQRPFRGVLHIWRRDLWGAAVPTPSMAFRRNRSRGLPDALSDALPDALPYALPDALSHALPDALPDALSHALPDAQPDVSSGLADAAPNVSSCSQ